MQEFHAVSRQRAPEKESALNSPYEQGRLVLNNAALVGRSSSKPLSKSQIWVRALATGLVVFLVALAIQWSIYDGYLHENGIRVVGSLIAAVIAVVLVQNLAMAASRQRKQEIERLETIALLNHHIRNALQAIVSCSGTSDSTDTIRSSVERIQWALAEVLPDLSQHSGKRPESRHI